ncbi:MAG: hypothetical protein AAF348_19835 [Bacteroidota bacterium]
MNAIQIIDSLLKELKTDKAGLATALGVHKSTISNISRGYTKKISSNLAQRIIAIRPDINYDYLMGNSKIMFENDDRGIQPKQLWYNVSGKNRLSVDEIAAFVVNNIEAFENNEIFRIYKTSIENEANIKLLKEQLAVKADLEKLDRH